MKRRSGFVSNSSTSSFTCDICGYSEGYYDGNSISDFGVRRCENDHTFCEKHMVKNVVSRYDEIEKTLDHGSLSAKRKLCRELLGDDEYVKLLEDNEKELDEDSCEDILSQKLDEFEDDDCYETSAKYCPICSFANFSNNEFVDYFMKKNKMSREDIGNVLKKEFTDYKSMIKFLKKK